MYDIKISLTVKSFSIQSSFVLNQNNLKDYMLITFIKLLKSVLIAKFD